MADGSTPASRIDPLRAALADVAGSVASLVAALRTAGVHVADVHGVLDAFSGVAEGLEVGHGDRVLSLTRCAGCAWVGVWLAADAVVRASFPRYVVSSDQLAAAVLVVRR